MIVRWPCSTTLGQLTYCLMISTGLIDMNRNSSLASLRPLTGIQVTSQKVRTNSNGYWGSHWDGNPKQLNWKKCQSLTNHLFRIVALLGLVELLFEGLIPPHAAQANPPYKKFRSTPLPSQRDLWEARTNRSWKRELKLYLSGRTSQEVLTVGDLIELDSAGCFQNTWKNQEAYTKLPDAVSWCGNSDSLGMLIWMVLPFQKWRRSDARWWYEEWRAWRA